LPKHIAAGLYRLEWLVQSRRYDTPVRVGMALVTEKRFSEILNSMRAR